SVVSSVCACPCSVSFRQPPPPTFPPFPYTTLFRSGVLYDPGQREHWRLAEKPPAEFTARLRSHGVDPLAAGEVIVATRRPHDRTILDSIRELGLELQVVYNKGAVMVLPPGSQQSVGAGRRATPTGTLPALRGRRRRRRERPRHAA